MTDNQIIEELALQLYNYTHVAWTEEERRKEWERSPAYKEHYEWLADIALKYFKSIYYSL